MSASGTQKVIQLQTQLFSEYKWTMSPQTEMHKKWETEMLESSLLLGDGGVLHIGRIAVFISGSKNGFLSKQDSTTLVVIWCYGADLVSHMTSPGGLPCLHVISHVYASLC